MVQSVVTAPPGSIFTRSVPRKVAEIELPAAVVWTYVASLILLYLFVVTHTPLEVFAGAGHDDGLFISLGRYLSEGRWLGPFSQFTLMKGPGYPAFLALSNLFAIPASLAHGLFHCAAVLLFVGVTYRFVRSTLLSGLLFILLLWHPVALSAPLLRVLRDHIYFDQLLLLLALLILALFASPGRAQRIWFSTLSGLALGWFWLTREEGAWILPAIGLLGAVAAMWAWRDLQLRQVIGSIAIILGVCAATQLGFRAVNWWMYGKFVGVDFKEANFQRAMGALDSVRSGTIKPFVSVTHDTMNRVAEVSPTFNSLLPYFNGTGKGWEAQSCGFYPSSCGEIGGGWFIWALRGAAQEMGHFNAPMEASAFFGKLADEVEAACARGALKCSRQLIAEMPPVTPNDFAAGLRASLIKAFNLTFLFDFSAEPMLASNGTENSLNEALYFLQYPEHTPPEGTTSHARYAIYGWYYKAGSDWISVSVADPQGSNAVVQFARFASPDIVAHFSDNLASMQRFSIKFDCSLDCVVRVSTADGSEIHKPLSELLSAPVAFSLGQGTLYVDSAAPNVTPGAEPSPSDLLAARIRVAIFKIFNYLLPPVLVVGIVAFAAVTMFYFKPAWSNLGYVLGVACWLLALSRVALLTLIEATSFPALSIHYVAPAYFMLVCGTVFSCAALLQLSSPGLAKTRALRWNKQDAGSTP